MTIPVFYGKIRYSFIKTGVFQLSRRKGLRGAKCPEKEPAALSQRRTGGSPGEKIP
jgi:hypothetical protein